MHHAQFSIGGNQIPFDPEHQVRMTERIHAEKDPNTSQFILNQYLRRARVGRGQHGEVFLCEDLSKDGAKVAMKVVMRKNPRQDKRRRLRRTNIPASGNHLPVTDNIGSTEYKIKKEIASMKRCRHPNVVRLLEVIDDPLYKKIYMIMEYLGGGEIKWRDNEGNPILTLSQTRRICRDVIVGLEYLHCQGIIHRDIKPANLMWTEDRRTVKITDFGVAHISAAHLLAESRQRGSVDPDDELFLDDSDLAKQAGTPAFIAPEAVFDFGSSANAAITNGVNDGTNATAGAGSDAGTAQIASRGSTQTLQAPAPASKRPPITKAIDVWALGVTMYSMLFGRTPYVAETEFQLYVKICNEDWNVRETMGVEAIPTGGRPADLKNGPPGAIVVSLLEGLMEKDVSKRMTLDEFKQHPWMLADIADPGQWAKETTPEFQREEVTEKAISEAVSPLKFRWRWKERISSFLKPLRAQRSFRSVGDRSENNVGVRSAPYSVQRVTKRSRTTTTRRSQEKRREKVPTSSRPNSFYRSNGDVTDHRSTAQRSASTDRRPLSPSSANSAVLHSPPAASIISRRGSIPFLALPGPRESQPGSVRSFSPTSGNGLDDYHREKTRSRFSLSNLGRWRVGKHVSYGPGPHEASTSSVTSPTASPSTGPSRQNSGGLPSSSAPRASDEIRSHHYSPRVNYFPGTAPAMRASSWGDVGEYAGRQAAAEVTSVHSGEREDGLDDDVLLFGAGGVANGPLPPTPDGGIVVHAPPVPPLGLDALVAEPVGAVAYGLQPDPHFEFGATPRPRAHAPSPLTQLSSSSGEEEYDDDSESSFFARASEDTREPPTAREIFDDEDVESSSSEEEEEEDVGPIEVRRRRPSWAVMEPSPPMSGSEDA